MSVFVPLGSLSALLGVALGAFGAHILKARISPDLFAVYQTAVLYHLVHALGLILVGLLCQVHPGNRLLPRAGWTLLAGTALFSGSLYLLAMTGVRWLGAITPLGGVAFLAGWGLVAAAALVTRGAPQAPGGKS
ncbi:hypothetical protein DBW_3079 [Desulfuromonas sp. DDH964]|uniref:DUF423 domain-containing protein n=1 Tax=Desulfuromonas sp. DDH964 TaxID=1823759 RepID=UPI00078B9E57|nr:DUF423 domain-containing protein [Desulfuromonas sp. DDH964]AMV73387.1 hypothetical protein DBW_3079 [Desulfuromonas sp. DDH964]